MNNNVATFHVSECKQVGDRLLITSCHMKQLTPIPDKMYLML